MVAPKNFDQANALISRIMENAGGSANAYEDLVAEKPEPVQEVPETTPAEPEITDEDRLDGGDICVNGIAILPEGRTWFGSPPAIDEAYEPKGIVDEAGELLAVYEALCESVDVGTPRDAKLESGTYRTELGGHNWMLKDPVKDRLYYQEDVSSTYEVIHEGDIFIWVMQISDNDADLGYIHEGFVFLHK